MVRNEDWKKGYNQALNEINVPRVVLSIEECEPVRMDLTEKVNLPLKFFDESHNVIGGHWCDSSGNFGIWS